MSNFDEESALIGVFVGVLVFPVLALLTMFRGWVVSVLWQWFVSDTFGLASLNSMQAIGLVALMQLVTHQRIDCKKEERKPGVELVATILYSIFGSLFILGFCWIIKQFV